MALEFVLSEKGRQKLVDDGYLYLRHSEISNGKTIWKCDKTASLKCPARLQTRDGQIVKKCREHNHPSDEARIVAARAVNEIKKRAAMTDDGTHRIVMEAAMALPPDVAPQMPSIRCLKRTIQRVRRQGALQDSTNSNPHNRAQLRLPESVKVTERNEEFLMFDSGSQSSRILIFATRQNLRLLASSKHWYAGGSFKSAPSIFEHFYTIHAIRDGETVPLVFALLPNKREDSYRRVFAALKESASELGPESITVDFEAGALNAIVEAFPHAQLRGCFFHFGQCVYREIQRKGLKERYERDAEFALAMRMLPALAFIPLPLVGDTFHELTERVRYPIEAQPIVDYFEHTWLGCPNRRNRSRPTFPRELWNVFLTVAQGQLASNISIEGWHRGFTDLLGDRQPSIWEFLKALQTEQSMNEMIIEHHLARQEPAAAEETMFGDCVDEKIKILIESYRHIDLIHHLHGIAQNLNLLHE